VYVGSDDGVVSVSPDAVTSDSPAWHRVGTQILPGRPVTQFAVDRSNWRIAYISYAGFGAATPGNSGHVFKTTDGGAHWSNVTGSLPDVPVNSLVLDPSSDSTLYAGTDVGTFVSINSGTTWQRLGSGMPKVASWQLDYDASHALLINGTHGRGAYTLNTGASTPGLVVSKSDSGKPVGPGSTINYTITVRNVGNAAATGVTIHEPIPTFTSFVSADSGGTFGGGSVRWSGLTVPAGGSVSVKFAVKITPNLASTVKSIVNDGIVVKSDQGPSATGSPHTIPIAPAHLVTVDPESQSGGGRVGTDAKYTVRLTNDGYLPDSYAVTTTSGWPATAYAADCTTPLTTTPTVQPGDTVDVCVRVSVPAGTADGATNDTTLTATSGADASVKATSTITTIAVAVDTLVVDGDTPPGPDVEQYYQAALTANGATFGTWDLSENPEIPVSLLTAYKNVVWFTGNAYPAPITPYESELKTYLDGGGRLFMSGQDILDQAAGTTSFVENYLHIDWDGTEVQNDKATAAVQGVAGNPVTDGIGTVPLNHAVLGGAAFEDEITPIGPAQAAFTDDASATDALTVADGGYKVVFLAFPFEAYGDAAAQASLMGRVLTYFG
jgi:uncharacterized repeat protein (TIGR01451 family)